MRTVALTHPVFELRPTPVAVWPTGRQHAFLIGHRVLDSLDTALERVSLYSVMMVVEIQVLNGTRLATESRGRR